LNIHISKRFCSLVPAVRLLGKGLKMGGSSINILLIRAIFSEIYENGTGGIGPSKSIFMI